MMKQFVFPRSSKARLNDKPSAESQLAAAESGVNVRDALRRLLTACFPASYVRTNAGMNNGDLRLLGP